MLILMAWVQNSVLIPKCLGFPGGSGSKESTCNAEDLGSIPQLGRSLECQPTLVFLPGESTWTEKPLQVTVHGVSKSRTRLSN